MIGLTVDIAAALTGYTPQGIWKMIKDGRLPAERAEIAQAPGWEHRIDPADLVRVCGVSMSKIAAHIYKDTAGEGLAEFSAASEADQSVACARCDLVGWVDSRVPEGRGRRDKIDALLRSGRHLGVDGLAILGKVSRSKYYRWRKAYHDEGLAGLLPMTGNRGRRSTITPDLARFMMGIVWRNGTAPLSKFIHNSLQTAFPGRQLPSYTTVVRWHGDYEEQYKSPLLMHRKGTGPWRSRYQLALGRADDDLDRRDQRWEIDSTPTDLMLITKKGPRRYAVIGVIDVYSRRAMVKLFETENSLAAGVLLRRAFIEWGLPDELVTDKGWSYTSDLVKRMCLELGIVLTELPGYAPYLKPHIERFFGTLTRDVFYNMTGATGANLTERPDVIEAHYTPDEAQALIDRWIDAVYHEREHGTTNERPRERGNTPDFMPRRVSDERALDVLLMPAINRTVRKIGIQTPVGTYYHEALGLLQGQRVQVRVDPADASRVIVYHRGAFLCVAEDPTRAGLTPAEITAQNKAHRENIKAIVRAGRELAETPRVDDHLIRNIEAAEAEKPPDISEGRRKTDKVVHLAEHSKAAEARAKGRRPADPEPAVDATDDRPDFFTDLRERFEWVMERKGEGGDVTADDIEAVQRFMSTDTYEQLAGTYEDLFGESLREVAGANQ